SAARGAAASSSGFIHLGPRHFSKIKRPGSRLTEAVHVRTAGPAARHFSGARPLNAPFLDPRGRDRSPEERRARHFNSGGDKASFT
ncbi:hypothetical protein M9458_004152, partial [Cirrhinus mrigala]